MYIDNDKDVIEAARLRRYSIAGLKNLAANLDAGTQPQKSLSARGAIGALCGVIVFLFWGALIVMHGWNWLLAPTLKVPVLSYWAALGIDVLIGFLVHGVAEWRAVRDESMYNILKRNLGHYAVAHVIIFLASFGV